ncbi:MAG: CRISPR-associated helicase Cas3', partial [Thermotogota bacterium]|nr:CRISPR-associated helicase Cas3' [Thermotogota bacterium]
ILIAPTGSGKTEYALYTYPGKKTIYLLPMKVSSNAMYERLSDIFTKEKVSLLHSEAFEYLSKKFDEDPEYEGEIRTNIEMAKNLAYPFIVCTGDQIFPSIMKYPSFQKIYTTFPNSKFVIDEVQSYDPKAIAMIIKAIEEIIDYGGNVIVITATLPDFFLEELKRRFDSKSFNIDPSKQVINRYNSISPTFCKHKFKLTTMNESKITEKALDLAKSGKRVMIVCNTVEYAQNTYKNIMKLKKDEKIKTFLLHSRYTLNDKKDKESTIIQEFKNPKSKDEIEPKILVSTQIIETSLDIDSDYMITEIAPIDVLIQRFGRVMRRIKEEDSFDLKEENVFIVTQNMEGKKKNPILESSKGKVYYPEALNSTLNILKNHDSKLYEKEKQTLVSNMYAEIFNEHSKIKQEFQNALQVFDSGYSSASKLEAQSMFREVANVDVIPSNAIDAFLKELKINKFSDYSEFKNKVLNKYVISMNYFLVNQNLKEIPLDEEITPAIRKWLAGIKLCTNLTYDKEMGAILTKEKNKTENPFI